MNKANAMAARKVKPEIEIGLDGQMTGGGQSAPGFDKILHRTTQAKILVDTATNAAAIKGAKTDDSVKKSRFGGVRLSFKSSAKLKTSHQVKQAMKPGSRRSVKNISPKPVNNISPKPVNSISPKPVNKISPKPVNNISPKPVNNISPKQEKAKLDATAIIGRKTGISLDKNINAQIGTRHKAAAAKGPDEASQTPVSAWDAAQKVKKGAARNLPGAVVKRPDAALKNSADAPTSPKAPAGPTVSASPESDHRFSSEVRRADGTPIVRDKDGNTRVIDSADPARSLGQYLKEEAGDEEIKRFVSRAAAELGRRLKSPKTQGESYIRQSEQVRAEAPERLVRGVRHTMQSPENVLGKPTKDSLSNLEAKAEERSEAGRERRVDLPGHKASAEAPRSARDARLDAERQATTSKAQKEPKGEGIPQEKDTDYREAKTTRSRPEADRIAFPAKTQTAVLTKASGTIPEPGMPTVTVDGSALSQSIESGHRVKAANHLASLLNARMDYILNNAKPEVRLVLHPHQLGEIQVRLISNGKNSTARVFADRESVGRALEIAAPQLAQQLQKAGFMVGQVDVEYTGMDFQRSSDEGRARNGESDLPPEFREGGGDKKDNDEMGLNGRRGDSSRKVSVHEGEIDVVV